MLEVHDDKYLVQAVLGGDRDMFVKLVRQYQGLVLHIVTPLIGVNEDREDICQDVFLKVYERLYTFQFRSRLGTWIGNIAYNTSINFLKRKRSVSLNRLLEAAGDKAYIEELEADTGSPEILLVKREQLNLLSGRINKLPELQRTVFILFYQDEQSLEEISLMLEMQVNTVKSHLFRARNSVRKALK